MSNTRKTGLAFSGGGVRSAAFCSGVLRRMLQKSVPVGYLSCVSGGGYTGSAYLDWKYRNEGKDDPAWHKEFFNNMRLKPNPFCDCGNPIKAIFETLILLSLLVFVALFLPWLTGFSFAIPTAFLVNFFFGGILRAPFTCPDVNTHNFTLAQEKENPDVMKYLKMKHSNATLECVPHFGKQMYPTLILFISLLSAFLVLFFISGMVQRRCKAFVRFFSNLSGFLLAMTLLPWFIEQYIVATPMWANFLIIIFSIFLWLGFPPLRAKASVALIVYVYAYAVKWRVYGTSVLGVEFTLFRFWVLMEISGVLIWMNPFLGLLQQNLVHLYNRWRLQKTYYSPESTGLIGCSGMTCRDIFPWCCKREHGYLDKPVTMGDLASVTPQYICNVTVHHWRRSTRRDERNYELLTISPTVIERIDRDPDEEEFEGPRYLNPSDIKLSTAMATSAAVVAYDLGIAGSVNEAFRDLQVILGLGLGKRLITDSYLKNEHFCIRLIPFLIQSLVALPIVVLPVIQIFKTGYYYDHVAVGVFLALIGLLTLAAILPTGMKDPGCLERFVRWCIVHIYHVRFIREMMGITNTGPRPPPVVSLSDGGHRDNLGLMALLKLRLPRIVVVNGGYPPDGDKFDADLLFTLGLAREKLCCSFVGMDGRDIYEDIRVKFINKPPGKRPRSYKFRVQYYDNTGPYDEEKVGEGEIILLSPRHPTDGMSASAEAQKTWTECMNDTPVVIDQPAWGSGPMVDEEEADSLAGCCCDCCHEKPLSYVDGVCGVFPVHSTANQLFTPKMFSAYHREGYRACVEAGADCFLAGLEDV